MYGICKHHQVSLHLQFQPLVDEHPEDQVGSVDGFTFPSNGFDILSSDRVGRGGAQLIPLSCDGTIHIYDNRFDTYVPTVGSSTPDDGACCAVEDYEEGP